MHKFRKLLVLLLFPLVMFSCGADKYYGYYMFQLGEEKGDHFGFHITLTKEKSYDEGAKEDSKVFKFGMKATGPFLPKEPEYDPDADFLEYLKEAFLYIAVSILNTEDGGPGVTGYYNIGKKDVGDKGRPLDLNIVIPIDDPDIESLNLENALKKLLIAYVDGKNVTAVLPVSIDDIFYQLAWYGYFISFDIDPEEGELPIKVVDLTLPYPDDHPDYRPVLPGKQGEDRLDTHPTDLDRQAMNEMFYCDPLNPEEPDPDSNRYPIPGWGKKWFERDFHTLTATLIKQ